MITILIADDEPINRLGLRFLLEDIPTLKIVGEVSNGQQAVQFAATHNPDVILMDIMMPELDGIMATKAIKKTCPNVKILMLTSMQTERDLMAALAAGANGYCLKDSTPEQFLTALETIKSGSTYLDSKVMPLLLNGISRTSTTTDSTALTKTATYEVLSPEDLKLLSMRMNGVKQEDSAKALEISLETLRAQEETIRQKIVDMETRAVPSENNLFQAEVCYQCDAVFPFGTKQCLYDGSMLRPEVVSDRLGTIIGGKYELLKFVGRGGGASVYKARHCYLSQLLAIKIIHRDFSTDFTMLQRFRGEAEVLSSLNHPNIVKVQDFGISDTGTPYLVMELLEGNNLTHYLRLQKSLKLPSFISVFGQVCKALAYSHEKGLIHRDVKPSNIFVNGINDINDSNALQHDVKLVDFGLAKRTANASKSIGLTEFGQVVGTPGYMSPETCKGLAESVTSDIYSLGCSMYECLTGELPFTGDSALEIMFKQINDIPSPLSFSKSSMEGEVQLAYIVNRCLQKEPSARFQSARDVLSALSEVQMKLTA